MNENKKFAELVNDSIKIEELSNVKGGVYSIPPDWCNTGHCSQKLNTAYCDGGAVCTSGIVV